MGVLKVFSMRFIYLEEKERSQVRPLSHSKISQKLSNVNGRHSEARVGGGWGWRVEGICGCALFHQLTYPQIQLAAPPSLF